MHCSNDVINGIPLISLEILTFRQETAIMIAKIFLACGTGIVGFEYIFLNYSAITQ